MGRVSGTVSDENVASRWWQTFFALLATCWIGVGVVMWHWDVSSLLLLYWLENIVIGLLQMVKMLFTRSSISGVTKLWWLRLLPCLFFLVHYGGFCGVHGMFLLVMGRQGDHGLMSELNFFYGPLIFVDLLRLVLWRVLELLPSTALGSLVMIALVRLAGFVGERQRWMGMGIQKLMMEPYKHIVVVHVAIILGAGLAMFWNNTWPVLLLIVVGKLVLDLWEIWGKPFSWRSSGS